MAIRLIVTDLDGTFLKDEELPHEKNRGAVLAARERGILVCGCTARNWACSKRIAELGGFQDGFIINGGAGIVDAITGDEWSVRRFSKEKARQVVTLLRPHVLKLNCVDTLATITTKKWINANKQRILDHPEWYDPAANEWFRLFDTEDVLLEGLEEGCQGIMCHVKTEDRAMLTNALLHLGGLTVTSAGGPSLHVMVEGATKGAGVLFLMERYGIQREEVLAVGDNENDLSMMEEAGVRVAVGNATERLKQMADSVVVPCYEGGFAQAVERYALA